MIKVYFALIITVICVFFYIEIVYARDLAQEIETRTVHTLGQLILILIHSTWDGRQ